MMNWIDKVFAYVSPQAAVRRVVAREQLRRYSQRLGYDGARRDGHNGGWVANGTSGNAENNTALPTLRDRSRDHIRNSGIAKKARNEFASKLVGYGMTVTFTADSQAVTERIQEAWNESSKTLSADGLPTEGAMQLVGAQALFESGEYLIRRRWRRKNSGLRVPIQFQILEPDLLDHLKSGPTQNGGLIVNGIEFDAIGRRVAYWLHPAHPGDALYAGMGVAKLQSRPVPADEISHVMIGNRPGDVRGVPHLHAVMMRLKDRERLVESELVRKAGEACVMMFVSQREGDGMPISGTSSSRASDGMRMEQMEPGMILYGRDGEHAEFNSPQSNGTFEIDKRCFDRDIAAGVGIPYEILTGDLSQTNYSSYRAGLLSFKEWIESCQYNWFIPMHVGWIVQQWLSSAQLVDIVPMGARVQYVVTPPAFNLLDRLQEAKADLQQVRMGTLDWGTAVARQGEDPEKVLEAIAYWNGRFDELGVKLDSDPRHMSAQGQEQRGESDGKSV